MSSLFVYLPKIWSFDNFVWDAISAKIIPQNTSFSCNALSNCDIIASNKRNIYASISNDINCLGCFRPNLIRVDSGDANKSEATFFKLVHNSFL